jgi:hypothetical protein
VAQAIREELDRQDWDDGAVIAAMREPPKRMLAAARLPAGQDRGLRTGVAFFSTNEVDYE